MANISSTNMLSFEALAKLIPVQADDTENCYAWACGFSPRMDWQGQKLSEKMMEIMLVVFAVVAFAVGYTLSSFQTMLLIYAGGVVMTVLITVPNWPFFNRHPLNWLDPSEADRHPKPEVSTAVPSKKKPSKRLQK